LAAPPALVDGTGRLDRQSGRRQPLDGEKGRNVRTDLTSKTPHACLNRPCDHRQFVRLPPVTGPTLDRIVDG
jgi:hypothetical protein